MAKTKKKIVKKKTTKKKVVKKKVSKRKPAKEKISKKKKKTAKRKVTPKRPKGKKVVKKIKNKKIVTKKIKGRVTKGKKAKKKTAKQKNREIRGEKEFEEIEHMLFDQRAELFKSISKSSTWEKDISKLERGDLQDMAATSLEREMTFALGSREREELHMINSALKKIASKIYGNCENCGEKINIKRLKIVPFAPYCMECKSAMEQEMEVDGEELFK